MRQIAGLFILKGSVEERPCCGSISGWVKTSGWDKRGSVTVGNSQKAILQPTVTDRLLNP